MNTPTNNPSPRDTERDDKGDQSADPMRQALKAMFDDTLLDGHVLKGTVFDPGPVMDAPIEWRDKLRVGTAGAIYYRDGKVDMDPITKGPLLIDQRATPPVNFKEARRFVRGRLDPDQDERVDGLCERYLAWELAVGAAEVELSQKTGTVAPVDFDRVRKYVRHELPVEQAESVRMAHAKYESWRFAIAAAEVELACVGDQRRD